MMSLQHNRFANLTAEDSVVVLTAGYQSRVTQLGSRGRLVFNSRFTKLALGSSGEIQFVILVKDSDTGGPSSIIAGLNIYLLCNSDVVLVSVKRITRQGESKIPLCNLSGRKILLRASGS